MKKLVFLFVGLFVCMGIHAQGLMRQKDKIFNFGVKAGLNSLLTDVDYITIDGVAINDIHPINNVGCSFELFGRVNIDHFFVQPSVIWKYAQGEVQFKTIQPLLIEGNTTHFDQQSLKMEIRSLEVPVMIGYSLIKENPYMLNLMIGTKFRYDYDLCYDSRWDREHDKNLYLSLYSAVEVVIGRLIFDFGYEHGLSENTTTLDYKAYMSDEYKPMRVKSRLDGLSMSIGLLF